MTQSIGKTSSSMQLYHDRLKPVLTHIQNNLTQPLLLSEAAKLSHFSKFHFQRIFTAVIGESLTQYTNRIRLERSASMLLFCADLSITQIAMQCGFHSSATYSRAFKLHFGVNPKSVRIQKSGDSHSQRWGNNKNLDINRLQNFHKTKTNYRARPTVNLKPVRFFETETLATCTLRSKRGYELASIFETWNQLGAWASKRDLNPSELVRFAICHDNPIFTPHDQCRYDATIAVDKALLCNVETPYFTSEFPAGLYAVFEFEGPCEKAAEFHMQIYSDWLPKSGYEPDTLPIIERYTQPIIDMDLAVAQTSPTIQMEVWFKVNPLRSY
jgi:AraC family transcriptional regulator